MTRAQAFNVAEFLAGKGYVVSIDVRASPVEGVSDYVVRGEFAAAGATAITGFQQLVTDAAQRGLIASIVKLSVSVSDA